MRIPIKSLYAGLLALAALLCGCAAPELLKATEPQPTVTSGSTYSFEDERTDKPINTALLELDLPVSEPLDPYILDQYTYDELWEYLDAVTNGGSAAKEALQPIQLRNAELVRYYMGLSFTGTVFNPGNSRDTIPGLDYVAYPIGETVTIDLDGDSMEETISTEFIGYREHNGVSFADGLTLTINGQTHEIGGGFVNHPLSHFAVVDLDERDSLKEIVISDNGPSDDPSSRIIAYRGREIIEVARDLGVTYSNIRYDHQGTITSKRRADLLHTWWYDVTYALNEDHVLVLVEQETYRVSYQVFLLGSVKLHANRDETSPAFIAESGEIAYLTALDDKSWVQMALPDGRVGWFIVENYNDIVQDGARVKATELLFCLWDVD